MHAAGPGKRVQMHVGILHPVAEAAELTLVGSPPEAAIDLVFGLEIDQRARVA